LARHLANDRHGPRFGGGGRPRRCRVASRPGRRGCRCCAGFRLGTELRGVADDDEHLADVDGLALGGPQPENGAAVGARDLDDRLRSLHLDYDLVDGDDVADGDVPLDDLGVDEAFTDVGQQELASHGRQS
jgi:hypothetical protein